MEKSGRRLPLCWLLSNHISTNPALPTLPRLWAGTLPTTCVCQLPVGGALRSPRGKETTCFASCSTHFITFLVSHSSSAPSPHQLNSVRSFYSPHKNQPLHIHFFFGGVSCDQDRPGNQFPNQGSNPCRMHWKGGVNY